MWREEVLAPIRNNQGQAVEPVAYDVPNTEIVIPMDIERFEHALALRDSGKAEEAVRELRKLVESTPDPDERASLVLNQSTCLSILGRFREAREQSDRARQISRNPDVWARADFGEACISSSEGKCDEAIRKFDCLLDKYRRILHTPENEDLYRETQIRRGLLLAGVGRFREARTVLEESLVFVDSTGDRDDLLCNLGRCYFELGYRDRAEETFLGLLKTGPSSAHVVWAHFFLGVIYSREGAHPKALLEFEWCLARAEEGQIPKANLFLWLAAASRNLGFEDDAKSYEKLADTEKSQL